MTRRSTEEATAIENFSIRLLVDGRLVAGFNDITPFELPGEVADYRDGGDAAIASKLSGTPKYERLTLERGLIADHGFCDWASMANDEAAANGKSPLPSRQDIVMEIYAPSGRLAGRWEVLGCRVSMLKLIESVEPGNGVAIERMRLDCEGWALSDPT